MTDTPDYRVAPGADISPEATIGAGSSIWHLAQVRERAQLGADCVVGRGAYIGTGVTLGDGCKVQNYALVYEPAVLADGVFVGPAAVFTNDHFPRAVNPDLSPKSASDWEPVGVTCEQGASIGARAVCVAPVTIGAWAMVAAGATVVKDVPPHALVAGVPARRLGWVGRAGEKLLPASDGTDAWVCPVTGEWYIPDETSGGLQLASAPVEGAPRPAPLEPDDSADSHADEQDGPTA
ncbi:acyltransferase [Brachybacterium sp. J144]|uniref:acyltransferase n=1 Tax=Brachybacterium sp. J144 TaxID=3116487 RepID=UPI002E79B02B|nr:acyltransferase [Brachybacterium sp. J144]MEE1649562.1 acyltransferase [Brachybacterium sp. J144]